MVQTAVYNSIINIINYVIASIGTNIHTDLAILILMFLNNCPNSEEYAETLHILLFSIWVLLHTLQKVGCCKYLGLTLNYFKAELEFTIINIIINDVCLKGRQLIEIMFRQLYKWVNIPIALLSYMKPSSDPS